jgi:hypothetical protein
MVLVPPALMDHLATNSLLAGLRNDDKSTANNSSGCQIRRTHQPNIGINSQFPISSLIFLGSVQVCVET